MRLMVWVTVLQSLDGVLSVLKCPFGERGWKIREKIFSCKEGYGLTYHCLLHLSGLPVEVCLKRREYRGEGCPWVLQTDEGTFLGEPLTSCKNERYCPSSNERFYSNQLYLYPACLVKKEERLNFTLQDIFLYIDINSIASANPDQEHQRHACKFKTLFYVAMAISIFLLLLLICIVICLARIIKGKKETETKRRRNEQQKEGRDLLKATGIRDHPFTSISTRSQTNKYSNRYV